MNYRLETLNQKKCIGKHIRLSFAANKTRELWQSFMPHRKEITNTANTYLYSLEIYPPLFFANYNPATEFEKWAAVEVTDFNTVPAGMQTLTVPEGLYAVFIHKGPASDGHKTYTYIFTQWLPGSDFLLDERPHFALMGENYKNEQADSEEEIWIPVRRR